MTSPIVLQKVIFPSVSEPDVVPLYLDADEWTEIVSENAPDSASVRHRRGVIPKEVHTTPLRLTHVNAVTMLNSRRGITVPGGDRVSLGTYFNAFPASYWRRWTRLNGVVLSVQTQGAGDIIVYRSNARGVIQTVGSAHVTEQATSTFDLPFDNFMDGGWYWFDLIARAQDFELTEADWLAPEGAELLQDAGKLTISITTLNRTKYCTALLETIGGDADTMAGIDRIQVIDQGSEKIRESAGFGAAQSALGDKLIVIDQVNAGGSGGFSRGMLEAVKAGTSEFLMLLDDDVSVEPESIRRAQTFARLCENPTIVGGHMFDMYDKTKLHAFAEGVDRWTFMWGPLTPDRHDFTAMNMRQTSWMHQRIDVDYNGWWMSLIPIKIIKEIGLSLPVFIKWDDAEYSLRAADHGYATVSLPGAAIWHVSWVDKDDSRDWQAFFHARNRLIAALLHSPHAKGGRLPLSNLASDVRYLLTMDYYTVKLRQLAYESVLAGPGSLHAEITSRLPQIRALAKKYKETTLIKRTDDLENFPRTQYLGDDPVDDGTRPTGMDAYRYVVKNVWKHWMRKPRPSADSRPDVHLPSNTPWWKLADVDSYVLSNAEGSGVTWHVRSRGRFRKLLLSSISKNFRYRRRWASLSDEYRSQLSEITSQDTWERSLGLKDLDSQRS